MHVHIESSKPFLTRKYFATSLITLVPLLTYSWTSDCTYCLVIGNTGCFCFLVQRDYSLVLFRRGGKILGIGYQNLSKVVMCIAILRPNSLILLGWHHLFMNLCGYMIPVCPILHWSILCITPSPPC